MTIETFAVLFGNDTREDFAFTRSLVVPADQHYKNVEAEVKKAAKEKNTSVVSIVPLASLT